MRAHASVNGTALHSAEVLSIVVPIDDAPALSTRVASLQSALVAQATAANDSSAAFLERLFAQLQAARGEAECARADAAASRKEKEQAGLAAADLVARANEASSAVVEKLFGQLQEAHAALAQAPIAVPRGPTAGPEEGRVVGGESALDVVALLERSNDASAAVVGSLFEQLQAAQADAVEAKAAAVAAAAQLSEERRAAAEQLSAALARANGAAAETLEKLYGRTVQAEGALRLDREASASVVEEVRANHLAQPSQCPLRTLLM